MGDILDLKWCRQLVGSNEYGSSPTTGRLAILKRMGVPAILLGVFLMGGLLFGFETPGTGGVYARPGAATSDVATEPQLSGTRTNWGDTRATKLAAKMLHIHDNWWNADLKKEFDDMDRSPWIFVYEPLKTAFHLEWWASSNYYVEAYFWSRIYDGGKFRTTDGSKADWYFMPIITARLHNEAEKHVSSTRAVLEHIQSGFPYYRMSNGSDHFGVASHDIGPARRMGTELCGSQAPIIANSAMCDATVMAKLFEHVKHNVYVNTCYHPNGISAIPRVQAHIPRFLPAHFRSKQHRKSRTARCYFSGWYGSRSKIVDQVMSDERVKTDPSWFVWADPLDQWAGHFADGFFDYLHVLTKYTFCLHIAGYQVWSPRIVEIITHGCIPVLIAPGYDLPLARLIDWRRFAVIIPDDRTHMTYEILSRISDDTIAKKQDALEELAHHFEYHVTPEQGDAFYMQLVQLRLFQKQRQRKTSSK